MRKKLITKVFLFIFVFIFISLFIISPLAFLSPQYARAGEIWDGTKRIITDTVTEGNPTKSLNENPTYPELSVPIGGFTKDSFKNQPKENWLGLYIIAWFNYIVGAIGIFAVYRVMYGGILWITAGGNASQIDNAKGKIKNAVIGIVLLLCTYTIFKTINPRMLSLQLPEIEPVKEPEKVCCEAKDGRRTLKYDSCDESKGEKDLKNPALCSVRIKVCEASNATKCGGEDLTNLCIGYRTGYPKALCVLYKEQDGYHGYETSMLQQNSVEVKIDGKIKSCDVESMVENKGCAIHHSLIPGISNIPLVGSKAYVCDITTECSSGNNCVLTLDENRSASIGCRN